MEEEGRREKGGEGKGRRKGRTCDLGIDGDVLGRSRDDVRVPCGSTDFDILERLKKS